MTVILWLQEIALYFGGGELANEILETGLTIFTHL